MDERIAKVVMPKWGLSMASGKVTEWVAAEGDEIADGDELADIDTDKITGSLEASDEGVLRRVIAQVNEDVPVGGTIALIAPAEVPEEEIEAAARQARAELDSGAVAEVPGPVTGTVEVGGRTLAYATLGEGDEHVVLVHGYGGDKNSWLFVQEPLSERRTVHALDLPGHGESSKDVGDGSLDTLADAVLGFLAAMEISRAHLVGHSLGGAVVVAAAAREPSRVASLTLVAPAGFGDDINADYLRGFATATSRRELKPHLAALFADPAQATRRLADDLMRYKRIDGVDKALRTLLDTLLRPLDVRPLLSEVDVPVTVLWGRLDAVLPATNAASLPGVRYVEGAGHMVHLESPSVVVEVVP
ncbi:acetoin dehydrogenase dihydrolipoyllysine-residue acetyltransferase subunit [Amycolatopsis acidiphila]|uniref:Acetoin dehydrogenase dihydrolipoyllysine-residue acetyltransferase subunit n=1 Tax=Amycolatopsis acidiphila TaxID=715473 RepID=A0A558AEG3_9PSEU|nr:acetoin dehydrogenase dihydrolipoyllysine-residue acetyltransferase subunit [Amycolatopsis acidiphila]TVT22657.1 acetoin dehydrogenase dihydrolipoyllysine-residue acetyltransferase subunit [Amycolatopsis acidiphila]UIJ59583.1 acetoin dehydrogenase dihydrolipoyllysine-residue acetyltransferase subunit [Amycolatopsis acidiphila]GHG80752.1 branched-chain alpha-keto acid dehydrogenase subunit E2 [Amycolatopsis acidiphila]